eukprot:CAMPEP_0176478492 /NCGR_PEP_ID=MMETSP0200_2-20121128/1215_1 /TAXON_ID=947934 /ORGANISM="Chaetoceros sp., Strain GSL56" /LENGTH=252 /DNA_ID=CAMNT_0017874433 /DNA_START=11 /DNA_END=765 /DNA_ORIENTATION=+
MAFIILIVYINPCGASSALFKIHSYLENQPSYSCLQQRRGKAVLPRRHGQGSDESAFALHASSTNIAQLASGMLTALGLVGYFDRPRGRLDVEHAAVQTKESTIEGAALGLFAAKSMPEGTVLGTYPGVLRPAHEYMQKYEQFPQAGIYAWRFSDSQYFLDPTDKNGVVRDFCYGGSNFPLSYFLHEHVFQFKVPTMLSRINEPPIGRGGCNVRSEENLKTREVVFSLSRDVCEGEEFFMDYGLTYDRSTYG